MKRRRSVAGLLILAAGLPALAHTPLNVGGHDIYWLETDVTYGIGWAEYPDWDAAVRGAFDAWNTQSTRLKASEDPALRGHLNIGDSAHVVVYDASNATGWFSDTSIVAVTPVWVDGSGRIVDADIVLNGRDHTFSADGTPGTFDLQAIMAHEVGHFFGFDHSGIYEATLFPYVSVQDPAPRTLSPDDVAAARSLDPTGQISISGQVERTDGAPIRGAHLVALDATGHAIAAALSRSDGSFQVVGLDPGVAVRVFAQPLDGAVQDANLTLSVESDFQTVEWSGGPVTLSAGQALSVGTLTCPAKTLSVTSFSSPTLRPSSTGNAILLGIGLAPPDVTFSVLGAPGVAVSGSLWSGSLWTVSLAVDAAAAPGIRTLLVTGPNGSAIVPGSLEVMGATPNITSISPSTGQPGDAFSLVGTGFDPSARVVVGGHEATGVIGGPTRFEGTIPAGLGTVSVTVQNPDGQWARLEDAFSFPAESGSPEPTPAPAPWEGPPPSSEGSGAGVAPASSSSGGGCSLSTSRSPSEAPLAPVLLLLLVVLLTGREVRPGGKA